MNWRRCGARWPRRWEDGAFGVSYALIYPPDSYTDTDELIEICKVVSRYHGVYITHMRSEAERLFEGLERR